MSPRFRIDPTLELLLDSVVANRRGRVKRQADLVGGERLQEACLCSVVRPYARVAVGLQLRSNRLAAGALLSRARRKLPGEVLNVVAVLMSHDVALGQRPALGAELRLKVIEETEIQVDLLVLRTIERTDRRRGVAATCRYLPREEHRLGGLIVLTRLIELLCPELLHAVDVADDPAILTLVRVGTSAALLLERARSRLGARTRIDGGAEAGRVAPQHQIDDHENDADSSASTKQQTTSAKPRSTNVCDLARVERGVGME